MHSSVLPRPARPAVNQRPVVPDVVPLWPEVPVPVPVRPDVPEVPEPEVPLVPPIAPEPLLPPVMPLPEPPELPDAPEPLLPPVMPLPEPPEVPDAPEPLLPPVMPLPEPPEPLLPPVMPLPEPLAPPDIPLPLLPDPLEPPVPLDPLDAEPDDLFLLPDFLPLVFDCGSVVESALLPVMPEFAELPLPVVPEPVLVPVWAKASVLIPARSAAARMVLRMIISKNSQLNDSFDYMNHSTFGLRHHVSERVVESGRIWTTELCRT
jgi:hypothetical protein